MPGNPNFKGSLFLSSLLLLLFLSACTAIISEGISPEIISTEYIISSIEETAEFLPPSQENQVMPTATLAEVNNAEINRTVTNVEITATPINGYRYTSKPGETIDVISKRFYVSVLEVQCQQALANFCPPENEQNGMDALAPQFNSNLLLPNGTQLLLPALPENLSPSLSLIPNSELIFSSA